VLTACIEQNEEGMFAKWLLETDAAISSAPGPSNVTATPTYYERNLTVWRQLWRVCELSSILLILLDVRCPPLHYPPSLRNYVRSLKPPKKVILVLTKCDLVPPSVSKAWKRRLENENADKVVCVESYTERSKGVDEQGTSKRIDSGMEDKSLQTILDAIEEVHRELCTPPEALKERPEKLAKWKPRVKSHIDWSALRRGHFRTHSAEEDAGSSLGKTEEGRTEREEDAFLTIGLIGGDGLFSASGIKLIF
jgi:hypothetical protein